MPERIQLSRKKGFNLQVASRALNGLSAVRVDRSTKWGNPWRVGMKLLPLTGKDQGKEFVVDQKKSVELFRNSLTGKGEAAKQLRELVRRELKGKNLACWCKPSDPCHGSVLLEIANKE